MAPLYDPVREGFDQPQNVLVAGSGITLGLTEEQKDEEAKGELEKRRVAALNFRVSEAREKAEFLAGKVKGESKDKKLK